MSKNHNRNKENHRLKNDMVKLILPQWHLYLVGVMNWIVPTSFSLHQKQKTKTKKRWSPNPKNMTLFENEVFADAIKL